MVMLMYNIHLNWKRETEDFQYDTYNRKHTVFFNGGPKIEIDTSPHFIRNPHFQCPEELLIASLSSCFLLTFLSICCKQGFVIDSYSGQGYCHLNEKQHCISEIILCPVVTFSSTDQPDKQTMHDLFKQTHERCFIANSLKVPISVNPAFGGME